MTQHLQSRQRVLTLNRPTRCLQIWLLRMNSKVQHRGVAWLQQRACCALVVSLVLWPAVVTAQAAPGVTFQVLYTFLGPPTDGQFPPARLTLDSAVP